jgi:lipid-A-disaccharide synthase
MKLYIIAGEASGDLHGANLIKQLKRHQPNMEVRCWGGDLMQQAGGTLVKHYRNLAFMGFVEVVANLRTILRNISFCKQDILDFKPDAVVLIDYPGFNLRIAEFAHQHNIKVFYYISPQVWAWHQSRVKAMRLIIDHLYVILPFEKAFFETHNMPQVSYFGHPLLDAIEQKKEALKNVTLAHLGIPNNRPIIAILPGSRRQELLTKLPIMLSVIKHFPDYRFVIAATETLPAALYYHIIKQYGDADVVYNRTYELLHLSTAALVTSGTATLETALLNIPQVVCYKASTVSYHIAKRLVDLKYISLVNLIMDEEVVKELIQSNLNTQNLVNELHLILPNGKNRTTVLQHYQQLRNLLGGVGASERVALDMLDKLSIINYKL